MRLASFSQGGMSRVGIVTDRGIIDVKKRFAECPSQMIHVIEEWRHLHSRFDQVATREGRLLVGGGGFAGAGGQA